MQLSSQTKDIGLGGAIVFKLKDYFFLGQNHVNLFTSGIGLDALGGEKHINFSSICILVQCHFQFEVWRRGKLSGFQVLKGGAVEPCLLLFMLAFLGLREVRSLPTSYAHLSTSSSSKNRPYFPKVLQSRKNSSTS